MLYKKSTVRIDYVEKDVRKTESRNHEMISRKITYPISDLPSRSKVMESSKKINGAEPVLWNQECENFDLLQKKTSGKEAKW